MKKIKRFISVFCVLAICLCNIAGFASAATGSDDPLLPNAQVPPGTDIGYGEIEPVITMTANKVYDRVFSNDYYIGRTLTSGTAKFYYYYKMNHSMAEVTHNYTFRAGLCYYNTSINEYVRCPYWHSEGAYSGQAFSGTIEIYEFQPNVYYYGFVRNLMSDGYISGNLYLCRYLL